MKKLFLLLIFSFVFFSFVSATTYLTQTENWHAYKVMKVALDGNSKIVVSVVDNNKPAQSLKTLMDNVWWTHAINGWFFCPGWAGYTRCTANTTDWLRKSNWTLFSKRWEDVGEYKSVFGFDSNGIPAPLAQKEPRSRDNWWRQNDAVDNIFNGLMMPTLVKDWIVVATLNTEMNNDPKQSKAGTKTFICATQDKATIYMWNVDGVTFSSLAYYISKTFACYNAIQLDNWWSSAMINNNKYIVGPWRNIMDAFVVIESGAKLTSAVTETNTSNEELTKAVTWMYNAGLTSKSTVADFLPDNTMTRQEASKFFSVFAKNEFWKIEDSSINCTFADSRKISPSLLPSVISACKMWLFKWSQGNFIPLTNLTNAQAITVLMRIMVGKLVEPTTAFYVNYVLKANEFGLIKSVVVNNNITRWEAAILIYRASIYREELNLNV